MAARPQLLRFVSVLLVTTSAALPFAAIFGAQHPAEANQEKAVDPWSSAETLQPADLVREITDTKQTNPPTILAVGFRTLFEGGHVPGAVFHGTASNEKGMAELKKWLADLPRSTNLVIYCGCCPFDHCPNIRPAYKAARELGFTRVRVLVMPTSFAADWVDKGYAMEKVLPGQSR